MGTCTSTVNVMERGPKKREVCPIKIVNSPKTVRNMDQDQRITVSESKCNHQEILLFISELNNPSNLAVRTKLGEENAQFQISKGGEKSKVWKLCSNCQVFFHLKTSGFCCKAPLLQDPFLNSTISKKRELHKKKQLIEKKKQRQNNKNGKR